MARGARRRLGQGESARSTTPRLPGFAAVCGSAAAGSFGRVLTQLTLSWVALELTGSPFLVGAVVAASLERLSAQWRQQP